MDGLLTEQLLEGRYRVVRRLAVGGMATVYVAEHTLIGRPVAIKILHDQFVDDVESVRRFLAEGRTAGTLGHPNIVESTDMGFTPTGAPFLVLELLEGSTLQELISQHGPVAIDRAVSIGQQIASALAAAHGKGIVHRDLKSGNVFLVDKGEHGDLVKVLDFGISKFMEAHSNTHKDKLLGTPWFMPPEQIQDPSAVDARCDVYALGVILYEMLSGQLPFAGSLSPTVFIRIFEEEPPPVESMRPEVGHELAAVVRRAMAKSLSERTQSMDEVGRALAAIGGRKWQVAPRRGTSRSDLDQANTPAPVLAPTAVPAPDPAPIATIVDQPSAPAMQQAGIGSVRAPRRGLVAGSAAVVAVVAGVVALAYWTRSPAGESADLRAGQRKATAGVVAPAPSAPSAPAAKRAMPVPAPAPSGAGAGTTSPAQSIAGAPRLDRPIAEPPAEASAPARTRAARTGGAVAKKSATPAAGAVDGSVRDAVIVPPAIDPSVAASTSSPSSATSAPPSSASSPGPESSPPATDAVTAGQAKASPTRAAPGTMDREATRLMVHRHLGEVQTCFERGRMDNPQLSGRVLLQIRVAPSGKVSSVQVATSTLDSQAVESCIVSEVKGWTLPAPAGGVAATITYPFVFK